MTAPGGSATATVQAILDFADLDREFAVRLEAAMARAEKTVRRNLASITANARTNAAEIDRAFDKIALHVSTREFVRELAQAERAADNTADEVEQAADRMQRSINGAGRSWATTFATVGRLAVTGFGVAQRGVSSFLVHAGTIATVMGFAAKAVRGFSAATFAAAVGLRAMAGVGLAKLAGVLRIIAGIAGRVAREVGQVTAAFLTLMAVVRVASAMTNFARTLRNIVLGASVAIGVIGALGAAFAALAVSVATAAGAAAGAAAGILGPALATLKLGFSGLAEAKKAFDSSSSGGGGESQIKAVASAAKSLASAEKSVRKAKEDSLDAEKDLTRARKDAQQQIDDLNKALRDNSLSEREAALDVRKAREDLAKTNADPEATTSDRIEAAQRVERAELSLIETQERSQEEAAAAEKAQRDGVEGAEGVISAKKRVTEANEALADAQEQVAEAAQALAEAQQGGGAGSGVDPFYAMIGQRMAPLLDAFDRLKRSVTDDLSDALIPAFQGLGGLLDTLRPKISGLAGLFGRIGSEASKSLTGPAGVAAFEQMTDASHQFFASLEQGENGLGGFTLGLAQFSATAASTVAGGAGGLNNLLLSLGERLRAITSEQITAVFDRVRQVFANIAAVAGPLISLFTQMGAASASGLAPGFIAVGQAIRDATPGLVAMANVLMPALGEALTRLAPLLPALVAAFKPWADILAALAPPLASIVAHMAPLAPYLLAAATAVKIISAAMVIWNALSFAGSVAQGVLAAALGRSAWSLRGNTIALVAHRIALLLGTAASYAFGVAMQFALSPIGLIIIAIAAVAAALYLFFTKTEVGKRLWEKIWPAIKNAVAITVDYLKIAWAWILQALQWIGDKAMWLWHNAIQPAFQGIAAVVTWWWQNVVTPAFNAVSAIIKGAGEVVMWLWNNIISPAFKAIGAIITYWWEAIGRPMFHNFQTALGYLGDAISWWWNSVVTPAFNAVGAVMTYFWDNVGSPVFESMKTALGVVGEKFTWFKDSVITPVWDWASQKIQTFWDNVGSPVLDKLKTAITTLGDAFKVAGGFMSDIWDTVIRNMRPAVHAIGSLLSKVPLKVGAWEIPGAKIANDLGDAMQKFRDGGMVRGPGTGTSDSVLLAASNGEMITNAAATARWLPLLQAINAGADQQQLLKMLLGMGLPAFAAGGLVNTKQLQDFARGIEGVPYKWNGWGNGWVTDCSGAASALANYATQQLAAGRGVRAGTGNMASFLSEMGAQNGIGPKGSLSFGWYNGGPYNGHIAMTLPTGENVEMGGARGNGQFGGQAAGANMADATDHMHFPPDFFIGGDLGGNSASLSPGVGAGLGSGTNSPSNSGGGAGLGTSSGGGTGTSATPGADTTKVFVTNWPNGSNNYLSPSTTSPSTPYESSPTNGVPYTVPEILDRGNQGGGGGLDAANAWAAKQDFAGQARDWAVGAFKEIFGQVSEPFGLKSLSDKAVDDLKTAAQALAEARANQAQPVVGVMNVNGTSDPLATANQVVEQLAERMTAVTGRYRNGG